MLPLRSIGVSGRLNASHQNTHYISIAQGEGHSDFVCVAGHKMRYCVLLYDRKKIVRAGEVSGGVKQGNLN